MTPLDVGSRLIVSYVLTFRCKSYKIIEQRVDPNEKLALHPAVGDRDVPRKSRPVGRGASLWIETFKPKN
jgi:hypothetical protein